MNLSLQTVVVEYVKAKYLWQCKVTKSIREMKELMIEVSRSSCRRE